MRSTFKKSTTHKQCTRRWQRTLSKQQKNYLTCILFKTVLCKFNLFDPKLLKILVLLAKIIISETCANLNKKFKKLKQQFYSLNKTNKKNNASQKLLYLANTFIFFTYWIIACQQITTVNARSFTRTKVCPNNGEINSISNCIQIILFKL